MHHIRNERLWRLEEVLKLVVLRDEEVIGGASLVTHSTVRFFHLRKCSPRRHSEHSALYLVGKLVSHFVAASRIHAFLVFRGRAWVLHVSSRKESLQDWHMEKHSIIIFLQQRVNFRFRMSRVFGGNLCHAFCRG